MQEKMFRVEPHILRQEVDEETEHILTLAADAEGRQGIALFTNARLAEEAAEASELDGFVPYNVSAEEIEEVCERAGIHRVIFFGLEEGSGSVFTSEGIRGLLEDES